MAQPDPVHYPPDPYLDGHGLVASATPPGAVATPVETVRRVPSRADLRRRTSHRVRPELAPWIVAVATLVLRLATAANGPTDWDSAQYASAVSHFDVTHGRPQPPGYWLYVEAGGLVHRVIGLGTVHSLVLVAAVASAAAAGLATAAGTALGGRWVGWAAGAVMATSPVVWFNGSIVATYSFDALACALLILLAWQARPGSWHGVGAVAALGLLAGFRQSAVQAFALLALIAVVASTRRWSRLALTVGVGLASVAVWLVPMSLEQPGGFGAWRWATQSEARGAAQVTSVLDHGANGVTNLGTFAAYTVVALAPLAVLAAAAGLVLLGRRWRRRHVPDRSPDPLSGAGGDWARPWYQGRTAVLIAAIVPPAAIVALVQFAKGGYLLAYLPAAVIALLLPVGALNRRVARAGHAPSAVHAPSAGGTRPRTRRGSSTTWLAVTTVAVALVVALGAQRFLSGGGVLPQRWLRATGGLWLQQPRYQAPYPDTRATVTTADAIDAGLRSLTGLLDPARDVVVLDNLDGGPGIYRNAGWSLPGVPIAMIGPGQVIYNELAGSLYYGSGTIVRVGPAGSAWLVASPALPGLAQLVARGSAVPVTSPRPIGGYRVFRVQPGTEVLGVHVTATTGPRPLGHGLVAGTGS